MNTKEIIDKIKLKGYWRVVIRPTQFEKLLIHSFSDIRKIVQDCSVSLRGWDYPHFDQQTVRNMEDWVEASIDWEHIIEYWRFYRSGQFIHLFGLHEDQFDFTTVLPRRSPPRKARAGYVVFTSITYQITEIYEFASRLANKGFLGSNIFISIELHNVTDYELVSVSFGRFLRDGYVHNDDNPIIIGREISAQDLITKSDDLAREYIIEMFERFQWNDPSREVIKEDQKKLKERRL